MTKKRNCFFIRKLLVAMAKSKYADPEDTRRVAAMFRLEETLHKAAEVLDPQKITSASLDRYDACLIAINELLDNFVNEETDCHASVCTGSQ